MGRSLDALSFPQPDRRFRGAVPASGSLEPLRMSGTGNRGPRDAQGAAGVGGVERRGLFGLAGDEAGASLGVVADAPLADPCSHDGADGVVPGGGTLADLALRQRRIRVGERLEDSPFRGFGPRLSIGGVDLALA